MVAAPGPPGRVGTVSDRQQDHDSEPGGQVSETGTLSEDEAGQGGADAVPDKTTGTATGSGEDDPPPA